MCKSVCFLNIIKMLLTLASNEWQNFTFTFSFIPLFLTVKYKALKMTRYACCTAWQISHLNVMSTFFGQNLAHIMSAGKLTSLHLDNAERLPWDMFFQLISGCLHCQMCLSALPEIFKCHSPPRVSWPRTVSVARTVMQRLTP